MKQALIYLRVSTNDQANQGTEPDGFSIPAQRRACQLRALSLDAKILAEFLDRGETGRNSKRPGLQALLSTLATEEVDYVIVHKLDRLARNRHDAARSWISAESRRTKGLRGFGRGVRRLSPLDFPRLESRSTNGPRFESVAESSTKEFIKESR